MTMTQILVFDVNGEEAGVRRLDILKELVEKKVGAYCTVQEWTIDRKLTKGQVVLAHASDLSGTEKKALLDAGRSGVNVILYSGGAPKKKVDPETGSSIFRISWNELKEWIALWPTLPSELPAIFEELKNRKKHLLDALAILSWCVSQQVPEGAVDFQNEWRRNNRRWLEVFSESGRKDLAIAAGLSFGVSAGELSEVQKFIEWVWPGPNSSKVMPIPDFAQIGVQLRDKFSMHT